MLKKFLGGVVFGTGMATAAIVIFSLWMTWVLPRQIGSLGHSIGGVPETITTVPPPVRGQYLGTTGSFTGSFAHDRNSILAAGDGRIVGVVTDGDRPVAGLRVRLALNGTVMSQWTESDEKGRYEIPLPFGDYRIDGYEIDKASADRVLANRIEAPNHQPLGTMVNVAKGKPAEGPMLRFVPPVEKLGPRGEVSARTEVIVSWKPYPGAASYSVQVREAEKAYDFPRRELFDWDKRPHVTEPSVNLTRERADMKPGHYYFIGVTAEDASGSPISETFGSFQTFDFKLVE